MLTEVICCETIDCLSLIVKYALTTEYLIIHKLFEMGYILSKMSYPIVLSPSYTIINVRSSDSILCR